MGKRTWLLGICLGLLGMAIGGLAVRAVMPQTSGYIPPLKVTGDVERSLTLKKISEIGTPEKIFFQGTKYRAIRLSEVIDAARPAGRAAMLYLIGSDGFASAIKAEGIADCYISYTAGDGWEAVNLNHPVSSNVKSLKEIVIVSDGSGRDFGFSVIGRDGVLVRTTPGQLRTRPLIARFCHEGDAAVQNGGKTYESSIYTIRQVFRLGDLAPAGDSAPILVLGEKGACQLVDDRGYFDVRDNYVNYLLPDDRIAVDKVKWVIVDPPAASIMDTYFDSQHYLENGEKVLVVIMDGLSYRQYAYAVANGYAPFLKRAGTAVKAVGVYPVAANVGFAAMITGKSPQENGIVTAKDHKLLTPTIFTEVLKMKRQAILLDTDQDPLSTEVNPVLATDENASGTADDELYAMALDSTSKGYDLVMVRFHGIAASGERYGAMADRTMESIAATDRYLEGIVARWPGRVIIAADQGVRPSELADSRVEFNGETMFVPYLLMQK